MMNEKNKLMTKLMLVILIIFLFFLPNNSLIAHATNEEMYLGNYFFLGHQEYAIKSDDSSLIEGFPMSIEEGINVTPSDIQIIDDKETTVLSVNFPKVPLTKKYSMVEENQDNPLITYKIGDMMTFSSYDMRDSSLYDEEIIVVAIGQYCVIWSGTGIDNSISRDNAEKVAKEYDDNIYHLMNKYYGSHIDADQDGKLSILYHDIRDTYEEKSSSSFIAGYFYQRDITANGMDIINMDTYPALNMGLDNTIPTLVHELTHLINFSHYTSSSKANTKNFDLWINEGLAESAPQTYGNFIKNSSYVKRINHYNKDSDGLIGDGKVSLTVWESKLENYDLSFLFIQYLRLLTQEYDWGGYNFFNSLYEQELYSEDIFTEWLFPLLGQHDPQYLDYQFADILLDFKMALTLNNSSGKYGFQNEKGFNIKALYTSLRDVDLKPGATIAKKYSSVVKYTANIADNIKIIPFISYADSYMYIEVDTQEVMKKQYLNLSVVKVEVDKSLKNHKVTWSTSNFFRASVDKNGRVKAKRRGKVTITAKCNKVTASINLQVLDDGSGGGCSMSGNNYGSSDLLIAANITFIGLYLIRRKR